MIESYKVDKGVNVYMCLKCGNPCGGNYKKESEDMIERFKGAFKCIQSDCDGHGNIPQVDSQGEVYAEQCEFHDKYLFPIEKFILQECERARKEEREKVIEEIGQMDIEASSIGDILTLLTLNRIN